MREKAEDWWAGEKIYGRMRCEEENGHCTSGESQVLHAAETGLPAVCLCFSTAESELVSLELSREAGGKGFLAWMSCCECESVLPGDLRCCTLVVLYHAVWSSSIFFKIVLGCLLSTLLYGTNMKIGGVTILMTYTTNNVIFTDALRWDIQGSRFTTASGLQNQHDCFITIATFWASYPRCLSYGMSEDVHLSSLS